MTTIRIGLILFTLLFILPACSGSPKPSLNSADPDLRRDQISILAKSSNSAKHFESFVTLLQSDPDYLVRAQAAVALGNLKNPKAIPYLIKALGDTNQWVRLDAAKALGKIGDPQAVQPLLQILPLDLSKGVRRVIVEALGKIGSSDAIPGLIRRLDDEDEGVAEIAYQSLQKITNQNLAKDSTIWREWYSKQK